MMTKSSDAFGFEAIGEERKGLVEGALLGVNEGEGAAKGAGGGRQGLVANRDGL